MKIYVASSWRNLMQQGVVHVLRAAGHEAYDFRHPPTGGNGFHWRDLDPDWRDWTKEQFREAIAGPTARENFRTDFDAMLWADACVLVLPCGRSAHLEAGYFVGAGKPLFILLADGEPELMYAMATAICTNIEELFDVVGTPRLDRETGESHAE